MNNSNSLDFKQFRKKSEPNKGKIVKARKKNQTTMEMQYSVVPWDLESFEDLYELVGIQE